jgi:hypothetical protein
MLLDLRSFVKPPRDHPTQTASRIDIDDFENHKIAQACGVRGCAAASTLRLTLALGVCSDTVALMILPDYWLTRPSVSFEEKTRTAFDELLSATVSIGGCPTIQFTVPGPKWQFLCHLADHHDIALHGSGDPNIVQFEPRQSNDISEFGNQKAVYAASDGLWAMFFAIVDRERVRSVANACIRVADEVGAMQGPYYVFSVSQAALPSQPWRMGTVYLMPRSSFTRQPPMKVDSHEVHIAQLASFEPVQPLAKLPVAPADFPFLTQIRGHDDERLQEYATALQTGAPWPSDV